MNTTVKSGGKKSTATNVVQMETMREYCPLLAVNPEITRIKTPHLEEGTAVALSTVLHETVKEYDSLKKLKVVGSDSTNKMSGLDGGTQTLLEQKLKRSLQRIFCLLHILETVWKRFKMVDGKSSSPMNLTGPIGKKLNDPNLRFKGIEFTLLQVDKEFLILPEKVVNGLSYDQKICYHLIQAVITGPEYFDNFPFLRTASLGKLHDARWADH